VVRRTLVFAVAVVASLAPVQVHPAAALNSWAGPFDGYRYVAGSGGPTFDRSEVHATISFGGDQNGTPGVATYECSGEFLTAVLDCTRIPTADLNTNSKNYPSSLHSNSLALTAAPGFTAHLTNGRNLTCYEADGPSTNLPQDQSAQWEVAGACTVP
jgi:hypothetical protein